MAIKKPITSKSKVATPAPSKLKKRNREVEEEVEETVEEEEEEEVEETPLQRKKRLREEADAAKAKKKKKAPPVEEEEEEEEPAEEEEENEADVLEEEPAEEEEDEDAPPPRKGSAKKKSKAKRSLADVFDETKPGRGLMPAGDFRMHVEGYEFEGEIADDPEDQGELKVKVTYRGAADEEDGVADKTISQWYQIADAEGNPGPGIKFLKGDLDILGYEDVVLADLQEIFDDVGAEEPLAIVRIKENGQYTNAYLQGLAETD